MLSKKLRTMLAVRGLQQSDLVRLTGLSKNTINGLATGVLTNTSLETLKMIADALHVNPAYFVDNDLVTPFDILEDVPEDIRDFMLKMENVPYLKLSQLAKEKGITPDMLKGLIDTLTLAMNRQKPTKKE